MSGRGLRLAWALALISGCCSAQTAAPDLGQLMSAAPHTLPQLSRPKLSDAYGDHVSGGLREALEGAPTLQEKTVAGAAVLPVSISAKDLSYAEQMERDLVQAGAIAVHRDGLVIRAHVPRSLASELGRQPGVGYISLQSAMTADEQAGDPVLPRLAVTRAAGASATGAGVKVGIIDFGFRGYPELQAAGVLPRPAAARGFGLEEGHPLGSREPHGAACAEVLHSVAPEAALYLATTDGSPGAWLDAANWMRAQGVDVVSFAGSWAGGELDGSDPLSRMLDEQSQQDDRLWVVSAGNAGKLHWLLPAAKAGRDGWIPGMSRLGNDTLLAMQPGEVPQGAEQDDTGRQASTYALRVLVRWDDASPTHGNRSGQDLDACLYVIPSPGDKPREIKCSRERQSENSSIPPEEELSLSGKGLRGQVFYLGLHAAHLTHPLRVHIFVSPATARLANAMPGSMLSPATAHLSLSVGAFDVTTNQLSDYSSQGPTDDGRVKPDIAGPADGYVESLAGAFHGTSASASFVAGMAAARASMPDHLRGQSLAAALRAMAAPFGDPVPNNLYGSGRVSAASLQLLPPATSAPPAKVVREAPVLVPGVPEAWGGPIPPSVLEALQARPVDAWQGGSKLVTGQGMYRVGDGLKLGIQVDRESAYLLFYRSQGGEYLFLEPVPGSVLRLPGGRGFPFPPGGHSLRLDSSWLGKGEFLLITAPAAVNWRAWQQPYALSNLARTPIEVFSGGTQ